jgi:hypothetical protein
MTQSPKPTLENLAWRLAVRPKTDWDDLLDNSDLSTQGNLALDRDYYFQDQEVILVLRQAHIIQVARNTADQAAAVSLHDREVWIYGQCKAFRQKYLNEHRGDPEIRQHIESDVSLFSYAIHVWLLNDCTALGEV